MPTAPNTPAVLTAIKGFCQNLQVNNATFFPSANVIVGKFKDITNNVPACEVTLGGKDETKRYSIGSGTLQGGLIDDSQEYLLEVTLDYTNGQTAETQLAQIRDSLTQTFHQTAQLNLAGQVAYSGLTGDGEHGYVLRNGQIYRVYKTRLKVRYEYSVIMQP